MQGRTLNQAVAARLSADYFAGNLSPYQYRYLRVSENLDGLAAQNERRDAFAAVGGHADQIAAMR